MSKASPIPERSVASRYSVAVCATLGVTLIRWLLDPLLGHEQPVMFFTLAITLAGWWGGFGPGILATVISSVLGIWAFIPPIYSFEVTEIADISRITVLVLAGIFISFIAESMHRAMRRSRASEDLYRAISASVTDLVYAKDLDSRITFANPATLNVIGKPEHEIVGHSDSEWAEIPAQGQAIRENDLQLIREGKPGRFEEEFKTRIYESIKAPLRDNTGAVVGLVGVSRDVTDRKVAEEQLIAAKAAAEAASKAKDDFLAALSHELRTPLTPVLFLAGECINDPSLDDDRREDWHTVQKNISLQARLIDDLLDLTRIARGKLTLDWKPLDVHAIVNDAMTMVRSNADAKQLNVTVDLDARLRQVEGDAGRLQQVFNNVLQNAVKFTPPGGSIFVQSRNDIATGKLIIEIADTGIGLTSEEVGRVFETFSQGEHATNRSTIFGGLGLGLSIAKEVLGLHNGRISGSSAGRNRGAIFTIELPTLAPNNHAVNPVLAVESE